ncbi:hypothetical protein [Palleronia sp.]|uniref:hypothetical protein n=1 Tax=Palleronia sp. TaxID=1940284 RepID=UPI0035C87A1E
MNARRKATTFLLSEDGGVTVDWVVLTAAAVGIGITVLSAVRPDLSTTSTSSANSVAVIAPVSNTTFP